MEEIDGKLNSDNLAFNPASIIINRKDDYLDKVEKTSTQLFLIAKNNNFEVMKQHISADKTFQISSGAEENFELFYILKGKVSYEAEEIILSPGDSITTKSGEEEKYFRTITEVELLYVTTNSVFVSYQKRIEELLNLIDKIAEKDVETRAHCDRLQKSSRLTAKEIGLEEKKLFNLGFASFLHDIGKFKVPTEILLKPAKLSDDEWEIMKKHTIWGKELILENFNDKRFNRIAEIIHQHHERYDGKGYPQGLNGDEILLEAQILAVVDAYDAMIYERPYQRAFSRKEALAEIQSEKGKQFAPEAVESFLKVENEFNNFTKGQTSKGRDD